VKIFVNGAVVIYKEEPTFLAAILLSHLFNPFVYSGSFKRKAALQPQTFKPHLGQ
jgi:hypothetical protein